MTDLHTLKTAEKPRSDDAGGVKGSLDESPPNPGGDHALDGQNPSPSAR